MLWSNDQELAPVDPNRLTDYRPDRANPIPRALYRALNCRGP